MRRESDAAENSGFNDAFKDVRGGGKKKDGVCGSQRV